jgi:hypothetical protein
MSKMILTAACATAVLVLAACDYNKQTYNNAAEYNAEGANYAESAGNYSNATDYNATNAANYANTTENVANTAENAAANTVNNAAGY